jgi:hypothetical protein
MGPWQTLRYVMVPQALRLALPAMTNDFVALLKDSSLVSVIAVIELTKRMTIAAVDVRSWIIPGLVCAAFYLVLSFRSASSRAGSRGGWRVISVRTLSKRHGDRKVLVGVSAEVTKGETIAIVGPSGSGKSTLLRCLNYLETFDEGAVEICGFELRPHMTGAEARKKLRAMRTRVGMVFQQFNLFPHLSRWRTSCSRRASARARRGAGARSSCSRWSGSAIAVARSRTNCPAASNSASPSPARSRRTRRSCCSTSRRARSTPRCGTR